MKPLRGAVIGAGYFSHFHYDAWNRLEDVQVVACCDLDASKADQIAQQYSIDHAYTDYRRLLDEHDVDFVDIVTRPDTHLPICRDVAGRGLAMICQKPLAPTVAEAKEIVDVARAASVRLMIHENFRFQPWYRKIFQLWNEGVIGDTLHTVTFRNRAGDGWGDDAYLARQPYFQTMKRFLIFEAGIHTVDTFRYLFGEIDRVTCRTRKLNPVIAGEDAAIAWFDFANGGMGIYDANRFNESTATNPRYTFGELAVEGNGGTIRLHDDGRLTVQRLGEADQPVDFTPSTVGFAADCVFATQQHFIESLRSGNDFETDGPSYLKSIAVTEAMYRSAESGQTETVTSLT